MKIEFKFIPIIISILILVGCANEITSTEEIKQTLKTTELTSVATQTQTSQEIAIDIETEEIYQSIKEDLQNKKYEEANEKLEDIQGTENYDKMFDEVYFKWARSLAENNQFEDSQDKLNKISTPRYIAAATDFIKIRKCDYYYEQKQYYDAFLFAPEGGQKIKDIVVAGNDAIYNKLCEERDNKNYTISLLDNCTVDLMELSLKFYQANPSERSSDFVRDVYLNYIPEKWYDYDTKEWIFSIKYKENSTFSVNIVKDTDFSKKGSYEIKLIQDEVKKDSTNNNERYCQLIIGNEDFRFRSSFKFTTGYFLAYKEAYINSVEGGNRSATIKLVSDPNMETFKYTPPKQTTIIAIPQIGMCAEEVEKTSWGKPNTINKSVYEWGTTEQWVYSDNRYVYLKNGIVTSVSYSTEP